MLVERQVQDSWDSQAEVKYARMRYELEIVHRTDEQGLERLFVTHEALVPILRSKDAWLKCHVGKAQNVQHWMQPLKSARGMPFISTEMEAGAATI